MIITNARQHVGQHNKGLWRTALKTERCSRYFGRLPRCKKIRAGARYFDTGTRAHVCISCACTEAPAPMKAAA